MLATQHTVRQLLLKAVHGRYKGHHSGALPFYRPGTFRHDLAGLLTSTSRPVGRCRCVTHGGAAACLSGDLGSYKFREPNLTACEVSESVDGELYDDDLEEKLKSKNH